MANIDNYALKPDRGKTENQNFKSHLTADDLPKSLTILDAYFCLRRAFAYTMWNNITDQVHYKTCGAV